MPTVELAVTSPLMFAFGTLMRWLTIALLVFKGFVLIDAALRREDAYRAADKQTKPFWLVILGLAVVLDLLFGSRLFSIFGIIGLIAAIVYLVDVRPALKQVSPPRRRDNRRGMGPYGPW